VSRAETSPYTEDGDAGNGDVFELKRLFFRAATLRRSRLRRRVELPARNVDVLVSRCTKLGDWRAVALRGSLLFKYIFWLH
jgi:hypothetical protein